jgi:hypothetical protein
VESTKWREICGYRAGFVFPRKVARRLFSRANICCKASCWRNNAWCSCCRAANRWACAWLSETMICFCWSSSSLRCSAFTIFCCKLGILTGLKKYAREASWTFPSGPPILPPHLNPFAPDWGAQDGLVSICQPSLCPLGRRRFTVSRSPHRHIAAPAIIA